MPEPKRKRKYSYRQQRANPRTLHGLVQRIVPMLQQLRVERHKNSALFAAPLSSHSKKLIPQGSKKESLRVDQPTLRSQDNCFRVLELLWKLRSARTLVGSDLPLFHWYQHRFQTTDFG